MDPIRRAGVVAFLDWVRRDHPEVRSLSSLSENEFLELATAFERSKGLIIGHDHQLYWKWSSTYMWFNQGKSDQDALRSLPN